MGGAIDDRHSGEQRLHFEDLGAQLRTRVTRVSEHGMTVEQALPFLRLHGRVHDESMRAAHIQSVSMVVYDGMPRLVLDLAYDEAGSVGASPASTPSASEAGLAPRSPLRAAHAGIARPRLREDTMSYETTSRPPVAGAASADPLALALTVPGEVPGEDRTRLFRTLPPSQMTLEEQMLRSGQYSFRLHRQWEQVWQPALEGTGIWLRLWARRCDVVLRPWLLRAGRLGLRAGRHGLGLASKALTRVRAAVQARRARRAQGAQAAVAPAAVDAMPEGSSLPQAAPAAAES